MGLLTKHIQASTLFEVLLAMVILATSFGIGIMIYLQVIQSDSSTQKLIANKQLEAFFHESALKKTYFDEVKTLARLSLSKEVNVLENDLVHFHLEATDESGKLISAQDHYILADE